MTASDSLVPRIPRGEDLPFEDGVPMETERHREQMLLLIDTLRDAWRERWDYYLGGNQAVYFSETQVRNQDFRAPDFFLVLDTERRQRDGWVVWEEDGRVPDVVIELLSASTEDIDRGRKKRIYERLRIPFYAVYDPFDGRFEAWALETGRYRELPKDDLGRVWCAPPQLFLGVHDLEWKGIPGPWLRWIDRDGRVLEDATGRAALAEERAAREAERAQRAEEEVRRLRAELARRGDRER